MGFPNSEPDCGVCPKRPVAGFGCPNAPACWGWAPKRLADDACPKVLPASPCCCCCCCCGCCPKPKAEWLWPNAVGDCPAYYHVLRTHTALHILKETLINNACCGSTYNVTWWGGWGSPKPVLAAGVPKMEAGCEAG